MQHRVRKQQGRDLPCGRPAPPASAGKLRRCLRRWRTPSAASRSGRGSTAMPARCTPVSAARPGSHGGARWPAACRDLAAPAVLPRLGDCPLRQAALRSASEPRPGARTPTAWRSNRRDARQSPRPKISVQLLPPNPKLLLIAWRSATTRGWVTTVERKCRIGRADVCRHGEGLSLERRAQYDGLDDAGGT